MSLRLLSEAENDELLAQIAATEPRREYFDLPPAISFDPADTEFLMAMRNRYRAQPEHATHLDALRNVASHPSAAIVGHGAIGTIFTGGGRGARAAESEYLSTANHETWLPRVSELEAPAIQSLLLCACFTGASNEGLQLLELLSEAFDADLSASTGLVRKSHDSSEQPYTESPAITLTRRAGEASPFPVEAPEEQLEQGQRLLLRTDLHDGGRAWFVEGSLTDSGVRFFDLQKRSRFQSDRWSPEAARAAAGFIAFDRPRLNPDPLASTITGTMILDAGGHRREFIVHNDYVVEDAIFRGTFYRFAVEALLAALPL